MFGDFQKKKKQPSQYSFIAHAPTILSSIARNTRCGLPCLVALPRPRRRRRPGGFYLPSATLSPLPCPPPPLSPAWRLCLSSRVAVAKLSPLLPHGAGDPAAPAFLPAAPSRLTASASADGSCPSPNRGSPLLAVRLRRRPSSPAKTGSFVPQACPGLQFYLVEDPLLSSTSWPGEQLTACGGREEERESREGKTKEGRKANLTEQEAAEEDLALKEMTGPTAREEEEMIEAKEHDQEQLCNISRALAVLASASSVSKERQEFPSLVNKEIKLYNSMLEREDTEGAEEAKKAYMAAREESDDTTKVASEENVSSALIDKVDAMLQELEGD